MILQQKRDITFAADPDGTAVAIVPLAAGRGFVAIHRADFDALQVRLGTSNFYVNELTAGRPYVAAHSRADRGNVVLARLLMRARPGDRVLYADGDTFNLRRSNLVLRRPRRRRSLGI